jgi:CDP-diacylglycerol--glycerol-3-phosphate 3-phosphatidyltransferase
MANVVTLSRLLLLIAVARLYYLPPSAWQLAAFGLTIVMFVADGLDGYIARKRNETSLFGALFDIAVDRITELTLWIVAADNDLVPIWVPIVFIVRGVIVDTIRSSNTLTQGVAPFALMRTALGKFIVAGRFMRTSYAVVKVCAFAGLALQHPLPALQPALWADVGSLIVGSTYGFVYLSVLLCVLRGLPVIVEFVYAQRDDILKPIGSKQ